MKKIPEPLVVFAATFLFFLATLAENFSGPHDSITYLTGIVDGYPLVNQHHLLYHYAAWCWLHLWQPIFPSVKDYYIIETFSAMWGSASLAVVYSFFRNRFSFSRLNAAVAIAVVAFSYGFWFYSVNIEVYAPPLFFVLLSLYILTKKQLSAADWWKVILLHCLAIVFHQVNALFLPVILFKMWEQRRFISVPKWFARYAATGLLFVGGAYFIVGWIVEKQNTLPKWIDWMRGYAGGSVFWYPLSKKTPVDITYGFSHAFLGGHYVFQVPPVKKIIDASLSTHSLSDELYIARNISASMSVFLLVLTIILAAIMIWLLVRFIRNFRTINRSLPSILPPLIITFFVYSIFFTFWMPEILEFWILQTVLVWLLLIGSLSAGRNPSSRKTLGISAALAILLFCINYFGSIRWMQDKNNDWYFVKANIVKETVAPADLVILQDGWIVKDFMNYFTDVRVQAVPLKDSSHSKIDALFNEALQQGHRVFILPGITNKLQAPTTEYLDSIRTKYSTRLKLHRKDEPEMWVIQ
ncbi:MAG: hypothetical protein H7Y31_12675 [Chitinophagaceae bacterium]|nr:hypothetical protein [Chitinophagaceae bacterium]